MILLQDMRFAIRGARGQRGFVAATFFILAIGIGANSAMFSIFNSVLLRPLPYDHPNRIVIAWEKRIKEGTPNNGVTPADYLDWRSGNHVFVSLTGHYETSVTMTGLGDPAQLTAVFATTDMLVTYGVQPLIGSGFKSSDEKGGRVALLSFGFWQRRFGAATTVIGRTFDIDGQPCTVIGVMPRSFRMYFGREPDLYSPLVLNAERSRDRSAHDLLVVGRLRSGVTIQQAQAELTNISVRREKEWPAFKTGHSANLVRIVNQLGNPVRPVLLMLTLAVAIVLLIACANVANLLLARGLARTRELAILTALGAGRLRLVQLLLIESAILSLCAGVAGVALAYAALALVRPLLPKFASGAWIPGIESVSIDANVLAFSVLLLLLTALVFGLLPALSLSGSGIGDGLKQSGRSSSPSSANVRIRDLIVIAEAALSCILLVGATLLIASFVRLSRVNPGFRSSGLTSFEIAVPPLLRQPEREPDLFKMIVRRVSNLPSVRSAALTNYVPGQTYGWRWGLRTENHPEMRSIQDSLKIWMRVVSPGFVSTVGIPVLSGRNFAETETARSAPVALLSAIAARKYFPGEDALGKRIALGDQAVWRTVVGVVGNLKHLGLSRDPEPEIYVPLSQLAGTPFRNIAGGAR